MCTRPTRVAATLQRMQKKPERFDETLASEVAVRDGIRGVLACDIAQVGNVYALTARLIDPKTRAAVLTDQVQARNKDDVLRRAWRGRHAGAQQPWGIAGRSPRADQAAADGDHVIARSA